MGLAGGVLVDGFDVVVDLHQVDIDAVLVGPLVENARGIGVSPRHPAGIDRPADAEVITGLRKGGNGRCHDGRGESGSQETARAHIRPPMVWRKRSGASVRIAPYPPGLLSRRVTLRLQGRSLSDQSPTLVFRADRNPSHLLETDCGAAHAADTRLTRWVQ